MTGYEFGDIVLVPFPFTDQSATKRRPAVVISSSAYHRVRPDLIIMAITRQPSTAGALGEVVIGDWEEAGLLKPSVLKPVLTTIDSALLVKKLGRLNGPDQILLRQAIAQIIG